MYLVRTRVCVYHIIYTYGVGYGVAVCNERQYQSLCKWNGKIAVPLLFLHIVCGCFDLEVPAFLICL